MEVIYLPVINRCSNGNRPTKLLFNRFMDNSFKNGDETFAGFAVRNYGQDEYKSLSS